MGMAWEGVTKIVKKFFQVPEVQEVFATLLIHHIFGHSKYMETFEPFRKPHPRPFPEGEGRNNF
jgi:hypothetical protein